MVSGVRDRAKVRPRWSARAAWALGLAIPASSSAAWQPAAPPIADSPAATPPPAASAASAATPPTAASPRPAAAPPPAAHPQPAATSPSVATPPPAATPPPEAPSPSAAPSPPAATSPSAATSPPAAPDAATAPARPTPWIRRFTPTHRHRLELGVFGGVFLPHSQHELYAPDAMWLPYARVAGSIGLRVAYFPIRYVGAELDAAIMPAAVADCGCRANLYALRGHVIGQLPLASVVPFVLIGGGGLGARSSVLGNDLDLASHFGGGVKVYVHRYVGLRFDVRGTITSRVGTGGTRIVHPEVLLGVIVPLALQARDSDGDGLYDPGQRARPTDRCPDAPGAVRHNGCPDRDGDALADPDDRCPDAPGPGQRRGCPPLTDGDGDGVFDPGQVDIPPPGGDQCPGVAGLPAYIGCPPPDTDGDGVVDPTDRCVDVPETKNGYKDLDGCPDEVPIDLKKVVGALRGIQFGFMSDEITPGSHAQLDQTVDIMRRYPEIRVEIQGHTDAFGDPRVNQDLSRRRAEAVRRYIVGVGIAEERLRAVGYGGDDPVADNRSEHGRAQNRRIELRLLDANGQVITTPP